MPKTKHTYIATSPFTGETFTKTSTRDIEFCIFRSDGYKSWHGPNGHKEFAHQTRVATQSDEKAMLVEVTKAPGQS